MCITCEQIVSSADHPLKMCTSLGSVNIGAPQRGRRSGRVGYLDFQSSIGGGLFCTESVRMPNDGQSTCNVGMEFAAATCG